MRRRRVVYEQYRVRVVANNHAAPIEIDGTVRMHVEETRYMINCLIDAIHAYCHDLETR